MTWFPTPVWWVDADKTDVNVIGTGEVAGEGTVDAELAVVLSGDSSFAIEGSREQLLALLDEVAAAVRRASHSGQAEAARGGGQQYKTTASGRRRREAASSEQGGCGI